MHLEYYIDTLTCDDRLLQSIRKNGGQVQLVSGKTHSCYCCAMPISKKYVMDNARMYDGVRTISESLVRSVLPEAITAMSKLK